MATWDLDSSDGTQDVNIIPTRESADAFGRQRVNIPHLITSLHFAQSSHEFLINTATTGGGTVTHTPATSSRNANVGTSSGDSAIIQTKRHVKYNPGLGYIFTIAANVGAKKTNVEKRWGLFDSLNGMFFYQTGSVIGVGIRTNESGSVVNTLIPQSSWNIDKLDGTGESGLTLDESKHQLWVIDHIWHGAGPVRFGLHIGGKIIYVHQIFSGNTLTIPFTRTPVLPLRVEISNVGTSASSSSIRVVCFTASAENGSADLLPSYNFHASMGLTQKLVSQTYIPLISIRPKLLLSGIVNRSPILPDIFDVFTSAAYLNFQAVLNPTLTGASFVSVNDFSAVEFDISATAYSGGTIITQGYTTNVTKGGIKITENLEQYLLGLNIAGDTADILTIVAASTSNNNITFATISWNEFQ